MIAVSAMDRSVNVLLVAVAQGRVPGVGKGAAGAVPGTGTRRTNASSMGAASGGGPTACIGR